MNRCFSSLLPLEVRRLNFLKPFLSCHLLPHQACKDPAPHSKSGLSFPSPLEQLLAAHRRSRIDGPKPLQESRNNVYDDIVQGYLDKSNPGDAEGLQLQLIKKGFGQDVFLLNNLVNLYAKSGFLEHAHKVFDEILVRNSVSWTCLIAGYTQQGLPEEGCWLFRLMLSSGCTPSQFTFGCVLRACQELGFDMFRFGTQIHALIMKRKYTIDIMVSNSLISMYGSCSLESSKFADKVFDGTPIKNSITWNSIISVHSQRGNAATAFNFFSRMQKEGPGSGFKPNEYTFGSLITVTYTSSSDGVPSGPCSIEQILAKVSKSGFLSDLYVGSAMVSALARFCLFDIAKKVFLELSDRNAVSVNGLMLGLIKQKSGEAAVEIFKDAGDLVLKNFDSHVVLLSALTEFENLDEARRKGSEVHCLVVRSGLIDCKIAVSNGLVNMYSKCGAIDKAVRVFKCMNDKDQVSWNSVISGLDQNGHFEEALLFFSDMRRTGNMPSNFSIISSISSCASLEFLKTGLQIHCVASKFGFDSDISVLNSLITMYGECEALPECWKIFRSMPDYDQITWNSMVGVLSSSEVPLEVSIGLFLEMMQRGWRPNRVTFVNVLAASTPHSVVELGKQVHGLAVKCGMFRDIAVDNAFLSLYAKSNDMISCERFFSEMSLKDEVSWNSMVAGYVHNGLLSKAMDFVWLMMHNGQNLDCFTFTTVLSACSSVAALERGMEIHAFGIRSHLESDVVVDSALVDMYSKCGRIDYAWQVFSLMPLKNEFSWNAMISGYAKHGHGSRALEIFNMMQNSNLMPDHVTFVGVLSACSHSGFVEQGLYYFESMSSKYRLVPRIEHYSCVVDLLGRAGRIEKMEEFVSRMPMSPNILIWRTILGACCRSKQGIHTNLFKKASEILLELEPDNPVNYVLISNVYASKGIWEGVARARIAMKGAPMKKEAGCSWVTLKDGVHVFLAGDRQHPEKEKIYEKLHFLNHKMKEAGYVPQLEFAFYDLEAESKEELLSYHSEKLAVAFVLTRSSALPIRIMKNLRVCGDCHLAFCYISMIVGQKIILRDSNRFHHFSDGRCSCGDFW